MEREQMKLKGTNETVPKLQIGDLVVAYSKGRLIDGKPYTTVDRVHYYSSKRGKQMVIINDNITELRYQPFIITQEEADQLWKTFCKIKNLSYPSMEPDACISSVSGEPKLKHTSPHTAFEHAYKMILQRPDEPWMVYECGHCAKWHVGREKEVSCLTSIN